MLMPFIFMFSLRFFCCLSLIFLSPADNETSFHWKHTDRCIFTEGGLFNSDPESGSALMQHLCLRRGQGTLILTVNPLFPACTDVFSLFHFIWAFMLKKKPTPCSPSHALSYEHALMKDPGNNKHLIKTFFYLSHFMPEHFIKHSGSCRLSISHVLWGYTCIILYCVSRAE